MIFPFLVTFVWRLSSLLAECEPGAVELTELYGLAYREYIGQKKKQNVIILIASCEKLKPAGRTSTCKRKQDLPRIIAVRKWILTPFIGQCGEISAIGISQLQSTIRTSRCWCVADHVHFVAHAQKPICEQTNYVMTMLFRVNTNFQPKLPARRGFTLFSTHDIFRRFQRPTGDSH